MPANVTTYAGFTTTQKLTVWTGVTRAPGHWIIVIHGLSGGRLTDMGGDPGAVHGGWPPGAWQLLVQIDAGLGLPKWRVWAALSHDNEARDVVLVGDGSSGCHSHLYGFAGTRPGEDVLQVFSVGAAASGSADTSQAVPLYTPDESGLLIGGWLSGAMANYSLGTLTARTEVDGTGSTSRVGEETLSAHGPATRTATSSVAAPWAAVSIAVRDDAGASVTFPSQPIQMRTELALGANPNLDPATWAGLWTDITDDAQPRDGGITIKRGRDDETTTAAPSSMTGLTLDNTAGKYVRLNPNGPYYGLLNKNTPIQQWVNAGAGWDLRYRGFVSEFPPRSLGGEADEHMPVQADGPMRRLGRGEVLNSPILRAVLTGGATRGTNSVLSGYWPLESGPASPLPGGVPMRLTGNVSFGSGGPAGSAGAMTTDAAATAFAPIIGMPDFQGWRISWWLEIPNDFDEATDVSPMVNWSTPNSNADQWFSYVAAGAGGKVALDNFELGVNEFAVLSGVDIRGRGPVLVTACVIPSGADVQFILTLDGTDFTDIQTAVSLVDVMSPITNVGINGMMAAIDNPQPKGTISHLIAVADTTPFNYDKTPLKLAGSGYTGERAAARLWRLSSEEGVPLAVVGDDGTSAPMGPQSTAKFMDLVRDCEAADGGLLYEHRDARLAYQTRSARFNTTPAFTLDYSAGHVAPPLEPTDDDQRVVNDFTAGRDGGGSARVIDQGHVDAVGQYADSKTVNVADDDQLLDEAGWRVHVGTADDLRYPAITPNLNGKPALITAWVGLDVGQATAITNPGRDLPPGQIDVFAEGYTETIDTVRWNATINASPGKPWKVGVLDDDVLGRIDTDGSMLAENAGALSTTLTIATTGGPTWTTDPAEVPFDVIIGGERMTVTSVAPSISDAFGRSVSSMWGSADTGQAWTNTNGSASDYSVSGGLGRHSLTSVAVGRFSTVPITSADFDITATVATDVLATGASQFVYLMGRYTGTGDNYLASVEFTTTQTVVFTVRKRVASTETGLGGGTVTGLTHAANTRFAVRFQASGSTLRAKVWLASATEPDAWNVAATDTAITAAGSVGCRSLLSTGNTNTLPVTATFDGFTATHPQTFGVTRSVNGVSKTHAAGEDVRLAQPSILSL